MALPQHNIGEAAYENMSAAMGGVVLASHNMRAIASEFAKLSLELIDNATQVVDSVSKAKSWDQIIDIQNKFLKSSADTFAAHSAKMAELMTAWPSEMGQTYLRVSNNIAEAGSAVVKTAADHSGATAGKMVAAVEHASEASRGH